MKSDLAPILQVYQEIADTTSAMLEAARAGNWEAVIVLGDDYCEAVEKLRTLDRSAPLDQTARAMKHDLLVSIIENDADTRDLAMPRLAGLDTLLGRLKRGHPLLEATSGRVSNL